MKAKALLLCLGLFAVALGAQDSVKFTRTFKEGDMDKYKMHMTASMAQGDADISMTMAQTVKKVFDNGEADVETAMSEFKVVFNGNEMPVPTPAATTIHVDKHGVPTKMGTGPEARMQFMRYASVFYDKDIKVGDTIPIDYTDPANPKSKATGSVKLDSVSNGEAKLVCDLKVSTPETDSPMKINMTTYIDVASSKLNKMEGSMDGMVAAAGAPPFTGMKFTMERVK